MARLVAAPARALAAAAALAVLAPALAAQFTPGDIYVASWKHTIYKVDPATWTVTTFADASDGLDGVSGLAWRADDVLLALSYSNDTVFSFDAAGVATAEWTALDGIDGPFGQNGLCTSVGGVTWIANWDGRELLVAQPGGAPSVLTDATGGIAHPDGIAFMPNKVLLVANRDGRDVLKVATGGVAASFDTLPDQPMSIAMHPDGSIYVACLYGDVWKYADHDKKTRTKLVGFGRKLATPVIRFNLDYSKLLYTSSGKGNLLLIDPASGTTQEVLPAGSLGSPLGLEVVGGHADIGIHTFGHADAQPGTGDVVPSLDASGHPVFGSTTTLELRDFVGGATVYLGSGGESGPSTNGNVSLGIDLNGPHTIAEIDVGGTPGVAGDGDLDVSETIANDPALDGVEWFFQAWCFDPTPANAGVSLTNVLQITTRAH